MPFKSKAQRRWMYSAEKRGELKKGTAEKWERHTKGKTLPERVKNKKMIKKKIKRKRSRGTFTRKKKKIYG